MTAVSQPYECPDCGARTRVNIRTGRVYSHAAGDTVRVCMTSGTIGAAPRGGAAPVPPTESQPKPPRPVAPRPSGTERSVSVRALRGGLPSLGKRRP